MTAMFEINSGNNLSHIVNPKLEGLFLQWCIIEKFFNQIYVSKKHPTAAVSLETKRIKGITVNEITKISEMK